jgi:glycosyltransferase involved in cell wall biosynthesis
VSSHEPRGAKRALREIVLCSLEPWDDIWRRNQFFVDILLRRNPELRVLFIEPALSFRDRLTTRAWRATDEARDPLRGGRLHLFRPVEPLPRRFGRLVDRLLSRQARRAARRLGFAAPILWLNDATFAPLTETTDWPAVYDITDDWLLAPFPRRDLKRQRYREETIFENADAIVVCSQALAQSRGRHRNVTVIPNGVDVKHFQTPQSRPPDLPRAPVAVYVGSLHEGRIDIDLLVRVARSSPELAIALVGPDSLTKSGRERLEAQPQIRLLGSRPYSEVPAYLQHADLVLVPHLVTPFTESLDPIKAYECLAVGTPTVATPVAGFRDLGLPIVTASPGSFVDAVLSTLGSAERQPAEVVTWEERSSAFEEVLAGVARIR